MAQHSTGKDAGASVGKVAKNLLGLFGQTLADAGLGAAKGVGKLGTLAVDTLVNAADIAGDVAAQGTDFVTNAVTGGKGTNFGSQKWILDKLNEESDKLTTAADNWMDKKAKDASNALRKHTGEYANSRGGRFLSDAVQTAGEVFVPVGGIAGLIGKGAKAAKAVATADKVADTAKVVDAVADTAKTTKKAAQAKKIAETVGKNIDKLPPAVAEKITDSVEAIAKNGKIGKEALTQIIDKYSNGMQKIGELSAGKLMALKEKYPKTYSWVIDNKLGKAASWTADKVVSNPKTTAAAAGLIGGAIGDAERQQRLEEFEKSLAEEIAAESVSGDVDDTLDAELEELLAQIESNN